MHVQVIVHQNLFYKGQPRTFGQVFECDDSTAQQLVRIGKVALVPETPAPPVEAPVVADPEPAQDVPKKQGKAIRSAKRK